ncbi:class I SAM-dependent methyltransferase [Melioribacter sp. OK-6-Me]|uniref:class I SAM-dependent methyltransferase n=1 Tax=unclassified Melioribacter TaxID=2627329 RepID=UPI003EDA19FC
MKETFINNEKFYNEISSFYDEMISFDSNLKKREDFYKKIFNKNGAVADIGCGSGLDSIALAKSGFNVTAFDPSDKMIELLKKKTSFYNVRIECENFRMEKIPTAYNNRFDFVVSMGNTISHLSKKNLAEGIKRVYDILKPGGKFLVHLLNYDYFIKNSIRINSIKTGKRIIVRFYDFSKKRARFNILEFSMERPDEYQLHSVIHYIHKNNEINKLLVETGFKKIEFYADMNLTPFENNKEMFILCRK